MTNQLGGLAKKATYIEQRRREADGTLIVDGGDMLTPAAPRAVPGIVTPEDIALRAAALVRMQSHIGLNAMAVGERALALGLKELRKLVKTHRLRLLSANLVDARGKLAFEAGFVTEVAGVKVGLFGLTEVPEAQRAPITEAGLKTTPAQDAARTEVERLRQQGAAVVIALAHVGIQPARDLMNKVPGIDL